MASPQKSPHPNPLPLAREREAREPSPNPLPLAREREAREPSPNLLPPAGEREARKSSKEPTRRAFLGWWLTTLLAATVVTAVAPLAVYLFPPRDPRQMKEKVRIALDTPLQALREGTASRFDAPAGTAFVMADGGENNSPGDPTFGGFVTRKDGKLRAFAITCPHLGCSYAFDDGKRHFVCPCHGSEFALDGSVIHGPATAPLSHLTWQPGPGTNEIDIEGITIGS